jgi:hypothetical protein
MNVASVIFLVKTEADTTTAKNVGIKKGPRWRNLKLPIFTHIAVCCKMAMGDEHTFAGPPHASAFCVFINERQSNKYDAWWE